MGMSLLEQIDELLDKNDSVFAASLKYDEDGQPRHWANIEHVDAARNVLYDIHEEIEKLHALESGIEALIKARFTVSASDSV